jgi:hypothetical protein
MLDINSLILVDMENAQAFFERQDPLQPVSYATALKKYKNNLEAFYARYCPVLLVNFLKSFYLNPCISAIEDPSEIGKTLSEITNCPLSNNFNQKVMDAMLYYLELYANSQTHDNDRKNKALKGIDGLFIQLLSDLFKQPKKHETTIAYSSFNGDEDDGDSDPGSIRAITNPSAKITETRQKRHSNAGGYRILPCSK